MKSLSVKLEAMLVVIGIAVFSYVEVWGAGWKYMGTGGESVYFYDGKNVKYPSQGVVRVWTIVIKQPYFKRILKERAKEIAEGAIEKIEGDIKDLDQEKSISLLAESALPFVKAQRKTLIEIKCGDEMARPVSSILYDEDGEAIKSFSTPEATWDYIVPESFIERLYKEVCK